MVENRLAEVLDEHGLTQAQLARASGVSYSTINAVYKRKRDPSTAYKFRIVNGVRELTRKKLKPSEIFPGLKPPRPSRGQP